MATLPPQIGRRRTPPCVKKTRNRPAPLKGSSFPTLLLLLHTVVAVDLSSHLAAAAISPSPLVPYLLLVRNFFRFASRFRTGLLPLFISILLDYIIAILIRSLNHLFISIPISIFILICYLNHTAAEGRGILPISVSRNLLNLLSLYAQNIRHFNPFHVYSAMGQPLRLEIKRICIQQSHGSSQVCIQEQSASGITRLRLWQNPLKLLNYQSDLQSLWPASSGLLQVQMTIDEVGYEE
ncbi:hypothetical protein LXL04_008117 [Taraxacum kok-saghyz]